MAFRTTLRITYTAEPEMGLLELWVCARALLLVSERKDLIRDIAAAVPVKMNLRHEGRIIILPTELVDQVLHSVFTQYMTVADVARIAFERGAGHEPS